MFVWLPVVIYDDMSVVSLRIHSIPSVPVVDLFQKIRQQIKCYLMTAYIMEPTELQEVYIVKKEKNQISISLGS